MHETKPMVEVEITQPGRPTGIYTPLALDQLKLEAIYHPPEEFPFDLATIPRTCNGDGENLRVLLLSNISHPPKTRISCNLLGGIESDNTGLLLLAVPSCENQENKHHSLVDLSAPVREEIAGFIKLLNPGDEEIRWVGKEQIQKLIKKAHIQYRISKAEGKKQASSGAAWQPVDRDGRVVGYTEAEHYTDAEYTFFQLPYHFQHYVNSYLANDERILYAIRRPAMRSSLHRTFLGGTKLQDGVLIFTTQRLLLLVELTPLGSSGVRYGFNAQLGVLERLENAWLKTDGRQVVILKTSWRTKNSTLTLEWEFPLTVSAALEELIGFLQKFIEEGHNGRALRRASPGPVPESMPRLSDPAGNHPDEAKPIHDRFSAHLPSLLEPGEIAYAWALWPAWFEKRGFAQVFLVTNHRVQVIPDPQTNAGQPQLQIWLAEIAALEYTGSILTSHIGLFLPQEGAIREMRFEFPYSAEGAFHACFEAMRRCLAVAP